MKIYLPHPETFRRHLLWTLLVLSGAVLLSLGLLTLHDLGFGRLSLYTRGQLGALAHVGLTHFLLVPGLPVTLLLMRGTRPTPWMEAAGLVWAAGAVLFTLAGLTGGLETGWSVALSNSLTAPLVSTLQLLALLLATLAAELLALQVLAAHPRLFAADFREAAPSVAARILALALPVQASVLLVELLSRITGIPLLTELGAPLLPAFIAAWSWTPIITASLLFAVTLAADILTPPGPLPVGLWTTRLGLLALLTPQPSLLPDALPSFVVLSLAALNALLAATAWALGFHLLPRLLRDNRMESSSRLLAFGGLVITGLVPPLLLWANLLPANGGYPFSPWVDALRGVTALAGALPLLASFAHPGCKQPIFNRLAWGVVSGALLLSAFLILRAGSHDPVGIPVTGLSHVWLTLGTLLAGGMGAVCLALLAPGFRRP